MSILILGSGAFSREVYDWVTQAGYEVIGFYSALKTEHTQLRKKPIFYDPLDIPNHAKWVIGSGSVHAMKHLVSSISNYIKPAPAIIHPSCIVGSNVKIGNGTIISPGSVLTCDIEIGTAVAINISCTIGHDAILKDMIHLSPNTSISGYVKIGSYCEIGTHTSIIPKVEITDNVILGAGSVVTKNIVEPGTYVGIPAKKIK